MDNKRERRVELMREVESSLLFLHPRSFFQFRMGFSEVVVDFLVGGVGGEDIGFTHYRKVLVFRAVFAALVKMSHFCFPFWRIFDSLYFFFWFNVVAFLKRKL